MTRTSKAATAGSTKRWAKGLGRFFRGISPSAAGAAGSGTGAPARLALPLALFAALLAVTALLAAPAEAAKVHLFKEVFGSAAKPTFTAATGMAVDGSGHLLVIDSGGFDSSSTGTVSRFNPDGTPANFSALGTNVIDGQGGADTTPQGELRFGGTTGSSESQIAVDTSGTATDGDIYVTQTSSPLVDIFSEAGTYLGQLTESSADPFVKTCGVAVDSSGAVYVGDYTGGIHKFTPAANPPVKADNSANFNTVTEPCTLAAGTGPSAGFLFVDTYHGPISKIDNSSGEFKYTVFGESTFTVFVNPANGHLFSAEGDDGTIREFDVSGASSAVAVAAFPTGGVSSPRGVAARGTSDVYVNVATSSSGPTQVQVFDGAVSAHPDVVTEAASAIEPTTATLNGSVNPDGEALTECLFEIGPPPGYGETTQEYTETAPCVPSAAGVGSGTSPVAVHADLSGLEVGAVYHYRLKAANAHGPVRGADASFQTAGQRLIGAWVQGVSQTEATLEASIDPEGTATSYRFEWGPTAAYGNQVEGSLGSGSEPKEVGAFLEGLKPGTTYHYRAIATSGLATSETPDLTFTTYQPFAADTNCANQANRYGPSANLPDCRAYEMVSPVEKGGASIFNRFATPSTIAPLAENDQAALDGEKLAYTSYKPFGDAQGSYWQNQFIATRGPEGWSSHGISPPQAATNADGFAVSLYAPRYGAFSEDLSRGFLLDNGVPPLMPDGLSGKFNSFLRDNGSETYTTLTTELFAGSVISTRQTTLEGYTGDWSHVLFSSQAAFTPKAAEVSTEAFKLYDYTGGELHLVNILPGGEVAIDAVLGAPGSGFDGSNPFLEWNHVDHAVSTDGSRIFWTAEKTTHSTGRIFARIDGTTTIPVSDSVGAGREATFRTADASGSRVIFTVGEPNGIDLDLYSFDVDSETPSLIAGEVDGFLGASDDLSRIYFVSEEDLATGASAGKPNVYLDEEGTMTFVATLSRADVGGKVADYNVAVNLNPSESFVRVTPDGRHLAFQSLASLTGYDNTSLKSGDPATEVYVYDAGTKQLSCVSCNPSGARPLTERLSRPHMGGSVTYDTGLPNNEHISSAAWLPTSRRGTHIDRPLSEDGERLFFNSYDALVPHDTNGALDVYEWEAQGKGDCEKPGGCLSLISTGESHEGSEFIDASEGGRDAFFRTASSIAPQDDGLIDIYDARAGGGYPPPAPEPTPCFGDACQSPPPPPPSPTPSSASFRGAGDPQPRKAKQRCLARKHQRAKHRATKRSPKAAKRCKGTKRGAGR